MTDVIVNSSGTLTIVSDAGPQGPQGIQGIQGLKGDKGDKGDTGDVTVAGTATVTATGSTTARALAARFADTASVKDFGAVGDGTADDTAAIQAAFTAGVGRFPAGSYKISADLTITDQSIVLSGEGQEETKILVSHAGRGIVYTSTDRDRHLKIQGLAVVATNAAATIGVDITFPLTTSIDQIQVLVDDVAVTKTGSGKFLTGCIRCNNVTNPTFSRVLVEGDYTSTDYGIGFEGQCLDASITTTRIYLAQIGVQMGGTCEGLTISETAIVTVKHGIDAQSSAYEPWLGLTNVHINAVERCVKTVNRGEVLISNCLFYATTVGSPTEWISVDISGVNPIRARSILINNVRFNKSSYVPPTTAIKLDYANYVSIAGCSFAGMDKGIDIVSTLNYAITPNNSFESVGTPLTVDAVPSSLALELDYSVAHANGLKIRGAAAGSAPALRSQGTDTDIGLDVQAKGIGTVTLGNDGGAAFQAFLPSGGVNRMRVRGDTAGNSPQLLAEGSDTNIDLRLTPKGTGRVRFGSYAAIADTPVIGVLEVKDSGGTVRRVAIVT